MSFPWNHNVLVVVLDGADIGENEREPENCWSNKKKQTKRHHPQLSIVGLIPKSPPSQCQTTSQAHQKQDKPKYALLQGLVLEFLVTSYTPLLVCSHQNQDQNQTQNRAPADPFPEIYRLTRKILLRKTKTLLFIRWKSGPNKENIPLSCRLLKKTIAKIELKIYKRD